MIQNANRHLKKAVGTKWGWDEKSSPGSNQRKEWWYSKLAEARRRKLLRCCEQQAYRCCYCGVKTWHPAYGETGSKKLLATLEHVVPRSRGGSDHLHNLTMACTSCNNDRGDDFDAVEFYEMVVGLRPREESPKKVVDPEVLAKKLADSFERQKKLMSSPTQVVVSAYVLEKLNLWAWWDSWLTYTLPMLESE